MNISTSAVIGPNQAFPLKGDPPRDWYFLWGKTLFNLWLEVKEAHMLFLGSRAAFFRHTIIILYFKIMVKTRVKLIADVQMDVFGKEKTNGKTSSSAH